MIRAKLRDAKWPEFEEIGKRTGLNPYAIYRIVNGTTKFGRLDTVTTLAKYLKRAA